MNYVPEGGERERDGRKLRESSRVEGRYDHEINGERDAQEVSPEPEPVQFLPRTEARGNETCLWTSPCEWPLARSHAVLARTFQARPQRVPQTATALLHSRRSASQAASKGVE